MYGNDCSISLCHVDVLYLVLGHVSVFVTFMSWTLLFKPNEWMNEWTTCQTSRNFPYRLSVGVKALSSSDTNALPVLWMTPCLLIIGHKLRGWYGVSLTVTHQGVVPGAKSWSWYDCFVGVEMSAEIRLQSNSPTVHVIARPTGTFYGQSLPERSDFRTAVTNAVYATVQW